MYLIPYFDVSLDTYDGSETSLTTRPAISTDTETHVTDPASDLTSSRTFSGSGHSSHETTPGEDMSTSIVGSGGYSPTAPSTTDQQTSPGFSSTTGLQTTRHHDFVSVFETQPPSSYDHPSTTIQQQTDTTERQTTTPYHPPTVARTTTTTTTSTTTTTASTTIKWEDNTNEDYNNVFDHDNMNNNEDTHGNYIEERPTTTERHTTRPDVLHPSNGHQPTNNLYYPTGRPKPTRRGTVTTEAEERTAMIIGIVAGALIAVILVILLVLWLKSNQERSYKADNEKSYNYGPGPNAALLGGAGVSNMHQNSGYGNNGSFSHNGSMRNGSTAGMDKQQQQQQPGLVAPRPKPRNNKDVKEWYV